MKILLEDFNEKLRRFSNRQLGMGVYIRTVRMVMIE